MEIEKEQNIVVRYIPQYIVIETRYNSSEEDLQQQISKTTTTTKYECGDEKFELEDSFQGINFDQYDPIDCPEDQDDNKLVELKPSENSRAKSVDTKQSPQKRKNDSKAAKVLNDWFLSNLHVRIISRVFRQCSLFQFVITESLSIGRRKRCTDVTDEYD